MPVPFIDLKRFEPDFLDRWMAKCRELTVNTRFVLGPEVAELEQRLKAESGANSVVACANGTDAIQLALRAAGVGDGDLVLIPDMTFWATFEAVCNVGARPVTVDLDMADLQMDFDLFRKAAEEIRPKAAILVHLYGWGTARLHDFRQYCAEKGILLIEDGAQCIGTRYKGESLMKDAWLGTVSFYPAKVLGASGDAGAVYCSTPELAETVRQLGNHGRTTHYEHGLVGWNSRVGVFESSFLLLGMDYIDARMESRRKVAAHYRERFAETGIRVAGPPEGYIENGYLAVTLHDPEARPAIAASLKEKGIGFGTVYPGAMSLQGGAKGWIAGRFGGEKADVVARGILNPPLFAHMREEEVEEVMEAMAEAVAGVAVR